MLSYVLPTRHRPEQVLKTLHALASLDGRAHELHGGAEVIVVDNASEAWPDIGAALTSRLCLRVIRLMENMGAAARNIGVEHARGDWIVLLDDDSYPLNSRHNQLLLDAPNDVAAIGAEIVLPDGTREQGGLPEVIIGCGAAVRRKAFLAVGGYDRTFGYYAEEYDLCAKLIMNGWRIEHDYSGCFQVLHEKVQAGRDFNAIVHRLVRNNAWVMQRYAPATTRMTEIANTIQRYARIAVKEQAADGYAAGMRDVMATMARQPRREMNIDQWRRFTGEAAARAALASTRRFKRVAMVEEGKNVDVIRRVLHDMNMEITSDAREAEAIIIGTLSPGPMRDAWQRSGQQATMCA